MGYSAPGSQHKHHQKEETSGLQDRQGPFPWWSPGSTHQPLSSPNHTQQTSNQRTNRKKHGQATPDLLRPETQRRKSCLLYPFLDSHKTLAGGRSRIWTKLIIFKAGFARDTLYTPHGGCRDTTRTQLGRIRSRLVTKLAGQGPPASPPPSGSCAHTRTATLLGNTPSNPPTGDGVIYSLYSNPPPHGGRGGQGVSTCSHRSQRECS